jgi:carbamoyltransferase
MSKFILGISAYYHDSAAALLKDGEIIGASQEERYTRIKHDFNFPKNAVKHLLDFSNLTLSDIEAIVFYDKPFLKFERLLETYSYFSPYGFKSFCKAMPIWLKEKLFLRNTIRRELNEFIGKVPPIYFSEHHLSHAASAFFPSPFKEAAILTIDGVGEWATTSLSFGNDNTIIPLKQINFPHSLGLLYSAFTYYLGFKVNSGEYKLMGLAPYGNPDSEQVKDFINKIKNQLIFINDDGSFLLNMDYFDFAIGSKMTRNQKWFELFGFPLKDENKEYEQHHLNLALAIQKVTEEVVLLIAKHVKHLTNSTNLTLAGGVALNCVANSALVEANIFENIWIQPASGDAGGALGAALAFYYISKKSNRNIEPEDSMKGSYLGDSFSNDEIYNLLRKYEIKFNYYNKQTILCQEIAKKISDGSVVGWFQGRMEYGPRALGNRSILADPRSVDTQKDLNLKIKFREGFRPFAPSVNEEEASRLFQGKKFSPYMLLTNPVTNNIRSKLPDDYNSWNINQKLYFKRSELPAITHIDFSARVQTVKKEVNPVYHLLISEFHEITGYAILVNTSFNVRGEPIVRSPEDALHCFMNTNIDILVLENYIINKSDISDEIKAQFKPRSFLED